MNINKSLMIGLGIFVVILISLFSISLTMDVNAQSILSNNTNTSLTTIYYQLDISDLNLSNQDILFFDNNTNITTLANISVVLDYSCELSTDNISKYTLVDSSSNTSSIINQSMIGNLGNHIYQYNGLTEDLNNSILVNQTLDLILDNGLYVGTLRCMYNINTTNNTVNILGEITNDTTYNITNVISNETSLMLDQTTLITNKLLLVDNLPAQIMLNQLNTEQIYYNQSGVNQSNFTYINQIIINNIVNSTNTDTISLNFSIIDLSLKNCSATITSNNNGTNSTSIANYDYIFDYYTNYSYDYLAEIAPTSSNILLPINVSSIVSDNSSNSSNVSLRFDYIITCIDKMNNVGILNSYVYILHNTSSNLTSINNSNNVSNNTSNTTLLDVPFFNINVSQSIFGLGEMGYYKIEANNNSNVSITICPISNNGWIQCFMTPTFTNDTFPKIQGLPYTNKTGMYLISGVMKYQNYTLVRNTTYETANTLTANIDASKTTVMAGDVITFNATASSGIAPYTYKWVMHDGTKFTGTGAYKNYTYAGKFRVNLTVNDSVGNNYSSYIDVVIKNSYKLTVIVSDNKTNSRLYNATLDIGNLNQNTDSSGTSTFRLTDGNYNIYVSKENYSGYTYHLSMDSNQTVYLNMSFLDITSPKVTLLTDDNAVMSKDAVDLKFKAVDNSNVECSLYVANVSTNWYTLKDSGNGLLSDTTYTFELRDLDNGAYKWKIECFDNDQNVAYSEERQFVVSDGNVAVVLQSVNQNTESINVALDNMDKLSGDESSVADILNIKDNLNKILDRVNMLDKDIHDLAYRRDLDEKGIQDAQKNLTVNIENMKYSTPINLKITDSKTFVKYVHDEDLKSLIDEYITIKNLKLDKQLFLESTKSTQSVVIISTRVRNVDLYYLDGRISSITLVSKDIQFAKPEDEYSIKNSNTATFVEVIPKTVSQSVKYINLLNKEYTVLKDDPLVEYPSDISSIIYYINGTVALDEFQNTDTVLIEKNINTLQSTTGFSILGINSISDIKLEGQGVMIILLVLLLLFYLVVNFDIIDKIRNLNSGFVGLGSKKRVSYIKVLVNDAIDYLKTDDYDKAALIYREIKLSYESANDYVKRQVYDESFELCNQLDLNYAIKVLDKAENFIIMQDRNNAILEFEKLENTYNKLSDKYKTQIDDRFQRILSFMKNKL